MKMLILSPRLDVTGGVSNFTKVLTSYLSFEHQLVFRGSPKRKFLGPLGEGARFIWDYFNFFWQLLFWNPQVVFLNISFSKQSIQRDFIYLFLSKLFGKKVVIFWHGWNESFENHVNNNPNHFFRKWYRKADLAFCLSERFRKIMQEWGFTYPIHRTFTMISDEELKNAALVQVDGISSATAFRLLWIGRMEKNKGLFEAIAITDQLREWGIDASLTICGDGQLRPELEKFLNEKKSDYIQDRGLVFGIEKVKAFKESDALLFSSFSPEGMPTVIIEAMSHGLIIFSGPVGGVPDFFKNEMGRLFTENSTFSMANTVKEFLEKEEIEKTKQYNRIFSMNNLYASKRVEFIEKEISKLC
ncbi:MAG: glycosyltransferase [Bacteroidia bacterium]|nr:glycosyltransferase [Bacteroidia bacterium]